MAQGYHNILVEHKGSDKGQTRGLGATGGEGGKTRSGSGIPAKDFGNGSWMWRSRAERGGQSVGESVGNIGQQHRQRRLIKTESLFLCEKGEAQETAFDSETE